MKWFNCLVGLVFIACGSGKLIIEAPDIPPSNNLHHSSSQSQHSPLDVENSRTEPDVFVKETELFDESLEPEVDTFQPEVDAFDILDTEEIADMKQQDLDIIDELSPQDVPCTPGTECYQNKWIIMGSKLTIVVDDVAYNPEWFFLDVLPPEQKVVKLVLRSTGFNQLNLVDVFLEEGSNQYATLQWVTEGYPEALPAVLLPSEQVELKLTYAPQEPVLPDPIVFVVWSSDPDMPERKIVFAVKESGPDIEIIFPAANYGCGSYCHAREFTIENTGNQTLIIQKMTFDNPSPEWSLENAPPLNAQLPPKGTPGYSPIQFAVKYCDMDGDIQNDSNKLYIYSNDPDENPVFIQLNVLTPDECGEF